MTTPNTEHEDRFWAVASPLLDLPGISRSTMMGLPCLRVNTKFFGSFDPKTGDLLVKLPEPRVDELVDGGDAHAFAPAGRRFRQWAAIPPDHEDQWESLLGEAVEFVAGDK
jgi:hypothetical protein